MSTRAMPRLRDDRFDLAGDQARRVTDVAHVHRTAQRVAHDDEAAHRQVPLQQVQRAARRQVAVDDAAPAAGPASPPASRRRACAATTGARAWRGCRAAAGAGRPPRARSPRRRPTTPPEISRPRRSALRAQVGEPSGGAHRQVSPDSRSPYLRISSRRCLRSICASRAAADRFILWRRIRSSMYSRSNISTS